MIEQRPREYLHSWYLLIITFFSLLFLLTNRQLILSIPLCIGLFALFIRNGLKINQIKKIFVYALLFSFSLFMVNILYPSDNLKTGEIYYLSHFEIFHDALMRASMNMFRLFLVSFVSMSSGLIINYTKVVLHLIVHKGLRLFWGYPLLLAMNSIVLFKKEYERIRINAKARNLPLRDKLSLFFPLLVFAIRHSQRGALSLVTRGLNHEKSFYFSYDLSVSDRRRLKIFWFIYLILVGLALFPLG